MVSTAIRCIVLALLASACWATQTDESVCPGPREGRACVHLDRARTGSAPRDREPLPSARADAGNAGSSGQAGSSEQAGSSGQAGNSGQAGGAGGGVPDEGSEILIGEVVNARDLGGTLLADGAVVADGLLLRGPPLATLSDAGCRELSELGVHTIIDLRTESEREAKPTAPCAQAQARSVLAPLPVPYSVSPEDYIADLYTIESMREAFRALGDETAYPIYFHCTWGRDRTGVMAAVILLTLGAERDAIMEDYLRSRSSVGAYPESLEAVLDEIEGTGGIDAFLMSAGIPAADIATLRAMAVPQP